MIALLDTSLVGAPAPEFIAPAIPRTTNLSLHCGAHRADRAAVAAVPTPAATASWTPIPHHELLETVEARLTWLGVRIVQVEHALTRDGRRYFGVIQADLTNDAGDVSFVVGVRNSHDKSIPAGLVAGSQVFVCDNLAFSGEVALHRKHTKLIRKYLEPLTHLALDRVLHLWKADERRIRAYKATALTERHAHHLLIRALDAGACTPAQVPKILHEWRTPSRDCPDFRLRNLWAFQNAFTEVQKGSLDTLAHRTRELADLLDPVAGIPVANEAAPAHN